MANKFRFKGGLSKTTKPPDVTLPVSPPPPPVISEDQISKLVAEKLAQMLAGATPATLTPTQQDIAFLEEPVAVKPVTPIQSTSKTAKLPKATTGRVVKLEEKRLVIDDTEERADFDNVVKEFDVARGEESKQKKIVEELREVILVRMGENEVFEDDAVKLTIGHSKNETISSEAVVKALVCDDNGQLQVDTTELLAGVQQLLDLARLGILEFKKTDFERWVKSHGYSSEPFIVKHADKKRIVTETK